MKGRKVHGCLVCGHKLPVTQDRVILLQQTALRWDDGRDRMEQRTVAVMCNEHYKEVLLPVLKQIQLDAKLRT